MFNCQGSENYNSSKLSSADEQLLDLVEKLTDLEHDDILKLIEVSHTLPFISELEGGDAYIDILTKDNHLAVVVAQFSPPDGNFYNNSLVGEIMWRENEPGVYRTLEIGVPSRELKAIVSKDEIIVRQNVSAITDAQGKILGVLIVERNPGSQNTIDSFNFLHDNEVADKIYSSKELQNIAEYMNDSVILFDTYGLCVYANSQAEQLFLGLDYKDELVGLSFENLSFGSYTFNDLVRSRQVEQNEVKIGRYNLKVTCNSVWNGEQFKGVISVIRDTTEIKRKETELILKSTAIDEIHHRVKNNLQTIVSLIGLQSNRMASVEVKSFSRDIISRIRSISLTHEILAYNSVDSIDIKEILNRMIASFMSYSVPEELDLQFLVTGDEISLQSDTATTIAMVVNELIQNSIKHAFPNRLQGQVAIHIEKGQDISSISIVDDGIGLSKGENQSSIGLRLVKSLVKDKLRGRFDISSSPSGTAVKFTFTSIE